MNCRECRDWLLEASPLEIAGALGELSADRRADAVESPSEAEWREHAQACASCLTLAERILEAQEELAAGLELLTPVGRLADALAVASREAVGRRRRARRRRVSWGTTAAVAAGVLMIRSFDSGGGFRTDSIDAVARGYIGSALAPEVEALLDESVVVLETDDEDVVVFWFYQGRGE
jgi:hypothetical protein